MTRLNPAPELLILERIPKPTMTSAIDYIIRQRLTAAPNYSRYCL